MNPKQLIVPGAVLVGGYFLLKPGGLLEQIMGQLGGAAEGGAPMPDPYGYGGATTKPTDEIVQWTEPSPQPDQGTARTEPTVVNNYYYGTQGGNPNKASSTGQDTAQPSAISQLSDYVWLGAGAAALGATALGGGRAGKIGQAAKSVGQRAWDIGKRYAPRAAVVGAVAGATALAVGGDSTDWLGLGRIVPYLEQGLSYIGIQKPTAASAAPSTPAASFNLPGSGASVNTSLGLGALNTAQPATANPNRPSGGSVRLASGITQSNLSSKIAAAIKSSGGSVRTSKPTSGSNTGGWFR